MSHHEGPTHTSAPPKLSATLRLGAVHLTVSDLDHSVDFYEDAIGLRLHHREDEVAAMG
jgi:catechol 2,3-dioxygenase